MTKIKIKEIVWDDWNKEHIKKHNVTVFETETAAQNLVWHKKTYGERYLAVGRSGMRILSLVVKRKASTVYHLVTARDASKEERKKLYEKEVSRA